MNEQTTNLKSVSKHCVIARDTPLESRRRAASAKRFWGIAGQCLFLLVIGLALTGCLSRPAMVKQSFAFPVPALATNRPASEGRVLEIRQVRIAAPFDTQTFTYRTGPFAYEKDPYAEFLVPPAEGLTPTLRGYLGNSGLFREVAGRDSDLKADTIADVYVSDLYGDFRNKSAPAAVLSISFVFVDSKQEVPGTVLFQKQYEERVPFHPRTAAALMAGWNTALQRLTAALDKDLKTAINNQPVARR